MFWTRLGSPTGRAASGTVEEIEEHLKANKPVMLYFSSAPVRLDSVDDNQYQALRTFRAEMERRGLVESYESMTEFRDKFARQLAMIVIRHWEAADVSESSEFLDSVHPTLGSRIARLSDDAKMLLLETATDRGGMLLALDTLQGLTMTANSREFIEPKTPR